MNTTNLYTGMKYTVRTGTGAEFHFHLNENYELCDEKGELNSFLLLNFLEYNEMFNTVLQNTIGMHVNIPERRSGEHINEYVELIHCIAVHNAMGGSFGSSPPELDIEAFKEFMDTAHVIARSKGWWEKPPSFESIIANIHSEVSELFDAHAKDELKKPDEHCPEFSKGAVEMSDIIMRVFDAAVGLHITDLPEAMVAKMRFNMKRPYKHGNKKV